MAVEMLCIPVQCLASRVSVIRCVKLRTAIKQKRLLGKSLLIRKPCTETQLVMPKKALTTLVMLCLLHRADGRDESSESLLGPLEAIFRAKVRSGCSGSYSPEL